jgi:hypothetical protein
MMLARVWKSERPRVRPTTAASRDVTALKNEFTTAVERRDYERTFQIATMLEQMEPNDARWPRKCGDLLRMAGRPHDAAAAFRRAAKCYDQQGFHDRSRAMTVLARSLGGQSAHVSPEHDAVSAERARS